MAIVALLFALVPGVARADGDPASDVLVSQSLFLPWDGGASAQKQAQLDGVLQAAARGGYPIRVALIASASDLGSVTALWRQPRSYAEFLGQELSLVYRGRVLVVMPSGFGLYYAGRLTPSEQTAIVHARPPAGRAGLVSAAITAVTGLAAAAGHALPGSVANAPAKLPASPQGSDDPVVLIVFLAGGVLIAAAWTASLRARPPRLRSRRA
jgi:hypothetical protein